MAAESVRLTGNGSVEDWLFLAMAHARLAHGKEAQQWLARAEHWLKLNSPPARWQERLELQLLRREAGALLRSGGAATHRK